MSTRPNLQAIAAIVGLLLLLTAMAWWMASDEPVEPIEAPTYSGDPVERKTAVVPSIGDFDKEFNINDQNPFIPIQLRKEENKAIKGSKGKKPQPATKPPVVVDVPIPQLILPPLSPRRANAPECIGVISSEHGDLLLARMPGSDTKQLEIGQSLAEIADASRQWTLVALEQGNLARFRDPAGVEQIFAIGVMPQGAVAGAKDQSRPGPAPARPAPDAKKPADAPSGKQRPPRQKGGPQSSVPPGVPQAVPEDRPRGYTPRPAEPPILPGK